MVDQIDSMDMQYLYLLRVFSLDVTGLEYIVQSLQLNKSCQKGISGLATTTTNYQKGTQHLPSMHEIKMKTIISIHCKQAKVLFN